MIQEYNCYGDGDMIALKQGRGNWVRYSDHLAEVERAVRTALDMSNDCIDAKMKCDQDMSCNECRVTRIMEELKK